MGKLPHTGEGVCDFFLSGTHLLSYPPWICLPWGWYRSASGLDRDQPCWCCVSG